MKKGTMQVIDDDEVWTVSRQETKKCTADEISKVRAFQLLPLRNYENRKVVDPRKSNVNCSICDGKATCALRVIKKLPVLCEQTTIGDQYYIEKQSLSQLIELQVIK